MLRPELVANLNQGDMTWNMLSLSVHCVLTCFIIVIFPFSTSVLLVVGNLGWRWEGGPAVSASFCGGAWIHPSGKILLYLTFLINKTVVFYSLVPSELFFHSFLYSPPVQESYTKVLHLCRISDSNATSILPFSDAHSYSSVFL